MIEIPAIAVAISAAFLTGLILFTSPQQINIKVFSLATTLQMLTYLLFCVADTSIETRQFIARSVLITSNLALSIIILAGKNGR